MARREFESQKLEGMAALRLSAIKQVDHDGIHRAHMDLIKATNEILKDFRQRFDPPGAAYFEAYPEHGPMQKMWTTSLILDTDECSIPRGWIIARLSHSEFMARQGFHEETDIDEL